MFPPVSSDDWPQLFTYLVTHGEGGLLQVAIALSILIDDTNSAERPLEVVVIRIKQVRIMVEEAHGWNGITQIMHKVDMQGYQQVRDRYS